MKETAKKPRRKLPADGTLYFTDNGAVYCGRHLGMSAAYTGRDLSGQKVCRVSEADAAEWARLVGEPIACETCRVQARNSERGK